MANAKPLKWATSKALSWQPLDTLQALADVVAASAQRPQLIFKHSTRCSISRVALARLDASIATLATQMGLHYLDLLQYRQVSDAVASQLAVHHESPQALLLVNGECIGEWSHLEIAAQEIAQALPKSA